MADTTEACARGCSMYRRHKVDCEDQEKCRGCLPRRATHGHLCTPCHNRLQLMLTDAPTAHRWLTGHLSAAAGAARPREDHERRGTTDDAPPAPIDLDVLDTRDLLATRLRTWVDAWVAHKNLAGPGTPHTVDADAEYLLRWLPGIEQQDDIAARFDLLATTLADAHTLAPWRPTTRRCPGIPCPECAETNLVIYGGEENVTCASCRTTIPPNRYNLWTAMLTQDRITT